MKEAEKLNEAMKQAGYSVNESEKDFISYLNESHQINWNYSSDTVNVVLSGAAYNMPRLARIRERDRVRNMFSNFQKRYS